MANPLELLSREQFAGNIVRTILANTDLNDVAPGSSLATLIEALASVLFQLQQSVLKILEASDVESLVGINLDRKAASLGIPNGQGGQGRYPATQSNGIVTIGSNFSKVSSTPYAGKPAPFAGSSVLYLSDASGFAYSGSIYIGRGTVNRYEGPIQYTSVVNSGSYWTMTLSSPLIKSHPISDLVVMSQGGDRVVQAGTVVQVPANSLSTAISFSTVSTLTIPDGESTGTVSVVCQQFGSQGNALAGSITDFASLPFSGATVTNVTSFANGQDSEHDEDLRKRIKNFPATLSRGTGAAILAAIQGATDPVSGRSVTTASIVEPVNVGDSSKVYIDDGTGLEPEVEGVPYELLLRSTSGQEADFAVSQVPITAAVAIGSESGPFSLYSGLQLTITLDGVSETYTINPSNYANISSATAYEVVRDLNSQSNIAGFRTTNGGLQVACFDLAGTGEILNIGAGDWQALLGFPTSYIRPLFLYKNSQIQSFRGHTATLSTSPYPWSLVAGDLNNVEVIVDGVTQTITITDSSFNQFSTNIASATLSQWATLLSQLIAGVKFTVIGNTLVWSSYNAFSSSGSLTIPTTKANGSQATWIGSGKMWTPVSSGGVLSDTGSPQDYGLNRFTGEIEFIDKPAAGSIIEVGSRSTRASVSSNISSNGLFNLAPITPGIGNSKIVVGFDGNLEVRPVTFVTNGTFTPSFPDSTNAYNVVRLFANNISLFGGAVTGDYLYLAQDTTAVPGWATNIEAFYQLKAVGLNQYATNQTYPGLSASVTSGSNVVTVSQLSHGFKSGALITVTTAANIGGVNPSASLVTITVLDSNTYTYMMPSNAASSGSGTLDSLVYQADTWVEFEASEPQRSSWSAIVGSPQNVNPGMVSIFACTSTPQLVDFGSSGTITADQVVSTINSQIVSGTAEKVNPNTVSIRSNDYQSGTAGVLAVLGNAANLFSTGTSSSIQPHTAYSDSAYSNGAFPVVSSIVNQTAPSAGYATQAYLVVDKNLTDITGVGENPAAQSSYGVASYPLGFQELWLTGRYQNLSGRVYNNSGVAPFAGFMRSDNSLQPLETTDSIQTSTPGVLNRYANYGLRLNDLPFTENDRLVVELDNNPTDETVVVPMYKIAQILDIDAITGNGAGQVISFRLSDPNDIDPNTSLPRPFFDPSSIYSTFNFEDFKILTQSIGVYIDSLGQNLQARGSLTAVAADPVTGIKDGDTFTLNDGVNTPTVFEFDDNNSVTAGHIAVEYIDGQHAVGSLTAISAVPGSTIESGDTFTLNDGINTPTVFSFSGYGTYPPGTVPVVYTGAAYAVFTITAVAADPSLGIANQDYFEIADGIHALPTFQFTTTGSVGGGNIPINIPATASAAQVEAAIITAINGYTSPTFQIAATAGPGLVINLTLTYYGPGTGAGISTQVFANGVNLSPTAPAGGALPPTASDIQAAMITAINTVPGGALNMTASAGAGTVVNLVNTVETSLGNQPIYQNISHSQTLTPVGMSGGVNAPVASVIEAAMIAAINGVGSNLKINAYPASGTTIDLINQVPGPNGNQSISQSISNGQTLSPVNMSGGALKATSNNAIVLRSVSYGAQSLLRLSIQYPSAPSQSSVVVSHTTDFLNKGRTNIVATLPSSSIIAGSLVNNGTYVARAITSGNLVRLRFECSTLNPANQYVVGNVLNVGGVGDLAGSYQIVAAEVGVVEVLAPGIIGYPTTTFQANLNPLSSWSTPNTTLTSIASAITAYSPTNPVATATAIGMNLSTYYITNPTYITYEASTPDTSGTMAGGFSHHMFTAKDSGSAGIWQYDASNPSLNGIKATVQTTDSIFPNTTDTTGTSYSPIGETVMIVPTNTGTLEAWANFSAISSLPVLAYTESIRNQKQLQISSQQDGSLGAVQITGVSANAIGSFVIGNGSNNGNSSQVTILYSDAKGLLFNELVQIQNSVAGELVRPYAIQPTGASVTSANIANITNYFRSTTAVKYINLSTNTARLMFYRNGMGPAQVEPLSAGSGCTITFSNLGNGLVQVTSSSSAGALSARTGDMMYITPYGSSPFATDAQCTPIPTSGQTANNAPQYWGYPVVQVVDSRNIIVIAPNIVTFGSFQLNLPTDLVFIPAIWNEKNIRTNAAEGAAFATAVNGGSAYILVKALGGNMMSVWLQNSSAEATDDMKLAEMSVSTDDYAVLGAGFSASNQGTFRIVAHNGRNHMIVYNPNGGQDQIIDTATLQNGGVGTRKWAIGPITTPRPIRVLDGQSVQIGDMLRISAASTLTQWFPSSMIGQFQIIGIGYNAKNYTGFSLPHTVSSGTTDNTKIVEYIDIQLPNAPTAILDSSGNPVDTFLLGGNVSSIGFVEATPYMGFRQVSGVAVNPLDPTNGDVFLTPQINTVKMSDIYGSEIVALYKLGYSETVYDGIDGYKIYGGLIQECHKIIDGSPTNTVVFPGYRASGTRIEVLTSLIKSISMSFTVQPTNGVTLDAIAPVVQAAIASYVNALGPGQAVILSEAISIIQALAGVSSVTLLSSLPVATNGSIPVGDNEKPFVLDASTDIVVG